MWESLKKEELRQRKKWEWETRSVGKVKRWINDFVKKQSCVSVWWGPQVSSCLQPLDPVYDRYNEIDGGGYFPGVALHPTAVYPLVADRVWSGMCTSHRNTALSLPLSPSITPSFYFFCSPFHNYARTNNEWQSLPINFVNIIFHFFDIMEAFVCRYIGNVNVGKRSIC